MVAFVLVERMPPWSVIRDSLCNNNNTPVQCAVVVHCGLSYLVVSACRVETIQEACVRSCVRAC